MARYVTVSTKIPEELKDKMKKLGLKPSKVLRKALEDEIRRKEVQNIKTNIQNFKNMLEKIPMEEVVKSVREDRNGR